jgi:hypothetical protein
LVEGPRNIPASPGLLLWAALLYFGTSVLESRWLSGPTGAVTQGLVDLALTAGFFTMLLVCSGRRHRVVQTLSAVFGVGTLFALPAFGILFVRALLGEAHALSAVVSLAWLPLLLWYLMVIGHIIRSALDAPFWTGLMLAVLYVALGYLFDPSVSTTAVV